MPYNKEYIDRKVALIRAFLSQAPKNLLDISYSYVNENKKLQIQVVLLENTKLENEVKIMYQLREELTDLNIKLYKVYVSKKIFNKDRGCWRPNSYNWLDFLLFSKAEVL